MADVKISKKQLDEAVNKKILSLLGLSVRAGKLVTGTDKICDEIRRHGMPSEDGKGYSTCGIAVIASDASANTKKRIMNACNYYRVECVSVKLTQSQIADITGKAAVASCATFDRGFADGIRRALELYHLSNTDK
jgi:ribosomal protein L7Ae-like RNA K-turn-binding protein